MNPLEMMKNLQKMQETMQQLQEKMKTISAVGSAGGGVGAYRHSGFGRSGGEGLDDMMRKYPNWFSPRLREFGPAVKDSHIAALRSVIEG